MNVLLPVLSLIAIVAVCFEIRRADKIMDDPRGAWGR
jgi:hypothetical protein